MEEKKVFRTELTDDELLTMTGGATYTLPEASQSIAGAPVTKPLYGVKPFYGIKPLYGIKPFYGIIPTPTEK